MSKVKSDIDMKLDAILSIPQPEQSNECQEIDDEHEERQEIVTFEPVEYDSVETACDDDGSDASKDYQYVRETLYGVIERSKDALEGALQLAKASEHPRAYEVTSNLMKNVSEMSKDLLALHKTVKETKSIQSKGDSPTIQNNTQIVVGSTKDLQDILNKSGIKEKILNE